MNTTYELSSVTDLQDALSRSGKDFIEPKGRDFTERSKNFSRWYENRIANDAWSYSRAILGEPAPRLRMRDEAGKEYEGINFASQDYLNLSSHPDVKEAAIQAIRDNGVHSSGSSILMGNTNLSLQLERAISEFLHMNETVLFPTGWAAGYGAIQGLVRRNDHVVMDIFTHSCLQSGARAATRNIHIFDHLSTEHVRTILAGIRDKDNENAILVATEGLFSMHADTPDLRALQSLCHEFGAMLLVDVAHDLGCLGATGRGQIEIQGMLGEIDLVMGSFSKTFASNGGFIATKSKAVRDYLKVFAAPTLFSNALSPAQTASVLTAFRIIISEEGAMLRKDLLNASNAMRSRLESTGFVIHGVPSAIVPVTVGDEATGRLVAGSLPARGILANLAEYPVVPRGEARIRLQIMAKHTEADAHMFVDALQEAIAAASSRICETVYDAAE